MINDNLDKKYIELHNAIHNMSSTVYDTYKKNQKKFDEIQHIILNKIFSNIEASFLLLSSDFNREAKIVLRSVIESFTLYMYYHENPDKKQDILDDANLLILKNSLIQYNMDQNLGYSLRKGVSDDIKLSLEECEIIIHNDLLLSFNNLTPNNKVKILNYLKQDNFTVNKDTIEKLSIFFRTRENNPETLSYEKVTNQIKDLILIDGHSLKIKDTLRIYYNHFSQTSHGHLGAWIKDDNVLISYNVILISLYYITLYSRNIFSQNEIDFIINNLFRNIDKTREEIVNLKIAIAKENQSNTKQS